jgi:hypothetical protein
MAIQHSVKNGKLIIEVDVSEPAVVNAPPSSTGKTRLVATGSKLVVGTIAGKEVTFSINVMASR